ncbi:MAG TPA: hypothetical protein VLF40_01585 [Candidatus Saccharimonadales bacterium]|nr:hypothetical protein [Candidatus Saccharimonadales bacterium]
MAELQVGPRLDRAYERFKVGMVAVGMALGILGGIASMSMHSALEDRAATKPEPPPEYLAAFLPPPEVDPGDYPYLHALFDPRNTAVPEHFVETDMYAGAWVSLLGLAGAGLAAVAPRRWQDDDAKPVGVLISL